jgi:hypothetical protein
MFLHLQEHIADQNTDPFQGLLSGPYFCRFVPLNPKLSGISIKSQLGIQLNNEVSGQMEIFHGTIAR